MKHVSLLSQEGDRLLQTEGKIDDQHWFVTVGLNCWGRGETITESLANCKSNAFKRNSGRYLTQIAPREGFGIDPVDGSISWSIKHNAKECPICSVGKGLFVSL